MEKNNLKINYLENERQELLKEHNELRKYITQSKVLIENDINVENNYSQIKYREKLIKICKNKIDIIDEIIKDIETIKEKDKTIEPKEETKNKEGENVY